MTLQKRPSRFALALVILTPIGCSETAEPVTQNKAIKMDKTDIATDGLVTLPSAHSVPKTVERLKKLLADKGIELFAHVDHAASAKQVGMTLRPTQVLIFGNPKAGTPLMLAAPSIALDLPLKILVAEDADGKVWISYNSPAYFQRRHNLPADLLPNIAVIEALVSNAAQ